MSEFEGTMEERRAYLSAQIARQRSEFAQAYLNLHKPIEVGEAGLRTFGFIRQNSWIFVALPAALKVVSFFVGLRGGSKPAKPLARERVGRERSKGLVGHAVKWGGHGIRLFKIYRRVRAYFP